MQPQAKITLLTRGSLVPLNRLYHDDRSGLDYAVCPIHGLTSIHGEKEGGNIRLVDIRWYVNPATGASPADLRARDWFAGRNV